MKTALAPALDDVHTFSDAAIRCAWWLPSTGREDAEAVTVATLAPGLPFTQVAQDRRFDPIIYHRIALGNVGKSTVGSAEEYHNECKALLAQGGTVLATDADIYRQLKATADGRGRLLNGDERRSAQAPLAWFKAAAQRASATAPPLAPALAQLRALAGRSDRAIVLGREVGAADIAAMDGEIVVLAPDGPWEALLSVDPALTIIVLDDPVRHLGPSRAASQMRERAFRRLKDDPRTALAFPPGALDLLQAKLSPELQSRILVPKVNIAADLGPGAGIAAAAMLVPQVDVLWPGDGLAPLEENHAEVHPAFAKAARTPANLIGLLEMIERAGVQVSTLSRSAFAGLRERDRGRAPTVIALQGGTPWPAAITRMRFAPAGPRVIEVNRQPDAMVPFLAVDLQSVGEPRRVLDLRLNEPGTAPDPGGEIDAVFDALDAQDGALVLTPGRSQPAAAPATPEDVAAPDAGTVAELRRALQADGHPLPEGSYTDDASERDMLARYRALLTKGLAEDHAPRLERLVEDAERPALVVAPDAPIETINANRLATYTVVLVDRLRERLPFEFINEAAQIVLVSSSAAHLRPTGRTPRIAPVTAFASAGPKDILVDPRDYGFKDMPAPVVFALSLLGGLGVRVRGVMAGDARQTAPLLRKHGFTQTPLIAATADRDFPTAVHQALRGRDWPQNSKVALFLPAGADMAAWQVMTEGLGENVLTFVVDGASASRRWGEAIGEGDLLGRAPVPLSVDDLGHELRAFQPAVVINAIEGGLPVAIPIPVINVAPERDARSDARPLDDVIETSVPMVAGWPARASRIDRAAADLDRLRLRIVRRARLAMGQPMEWPPSARSPLSRDAIFEPVRHSASANRDDGPGRQDRDDLGEAVLDRPSLPKLPELHFDQWLGPNGVFARLFSWPSRWLRERYDRTWQLLRNRWASATETTFQDIDGNVGASTVQDPSIADGDNTEGAFMPRTSFSSLWPWPGTILLTLLCAWLIYMGSIADLADVRTAFYGMAFVTGIAVLLGLRSAIVGPSYRAASAPGYGDYDEDFGSAADDDFPTARSRFDAPRRSITDEDETGMDGGGMGDGATRVAADGMPRNARMRANDTTGAMRGDFSEPGDLREPQDARYTEVAPDKAQDATTQERRAAMVEDTAGPDESLAAEAAAATREPVPPRSAFDDPRRDPFGGPPAPANVSEQIQAALAREKADRGAALVQLNRAVTGRLDAVENALRALASSGAAAAADAAGDAASDALSALSSRVDALSGDAAKLPALLEQMEAMSGKVDGLAALSEQVAALQSAAANVGDAAAAVAPDLENRLQKMVTLAGLNNILNTKLLPSIDKRISERLDGAMTAESLKEKLGDAIPAIPDGATAPAAPDLVGMMDTKLSAMAKDTNTKLTTIRKEANEAIANARRAMQSEISAVRDAVPSVDVGASEVVTALQSRVDASDRALSELRDGLTALRQTVDGAAVAAPSALAEGAVEEITRRLGALEETALAAAGDPLKGTVSALEKRVDTGLQGTTEAVNAVRQGLRDLANNVSRVSDHYTTLLNRVDEMSATLTAAGPAAAGNTVQAEMDTLREQLLTIIQQNQEIKAQQQAISETFSQPARIEFGKGN